MIQIKTCFNGWKEVDEKTALEFATHLYNGATQKNMIDYINSEKLNGILFTEEQLIHNINSFKTEIISDKPIQVCKEKIKQEKADTLSASPLLLLLIFYLKNDISLFSCSATSLSPVAESARLDTVAESS